MTDRSLLIRSTQSHITVCMCVNRLCRSLFELWGSGRNQDELEASVKQLPSDFTVCNPFHRGLGVYAQMYMKNHRRDTDAQITHSRWL